MYKPASVLPYPKDYIKIAIDYQQRMVGGESRLFSKPADTSNYIDMLGSAEAFLENFIDVNENIIPTNPSENIQFGLNFKK